MAYQNVSTPRFYIDKTAYLRATGIARPDNPDNSSTTFDEDCFGLGASNPYSFNTGNGGDKYIDLRNYNNTLHSEAYNFIAMLGHNLKTMEDAYNWIRLAWSDGAYMETGVNDGAEMAINTFDESFSSANYDGFSIMPFTEFNEPHYDMYLSINDTVENSVIQLGRVAIGKYYEMPVAPDLSLSLEHDYSGIKKTTSMSGASFSNANWIKPPKWGDKEAWQLGDFPRPYSGRRVWDLSFNYLDSDDLEPSHYDMDENTVENTWKDNWFSNVIHYTMGGALPFIFQPNKDATYQITNGEITSIPELAICRFDMDTFSREQVAPNVYNIKVKIKETW